MADLIERNDNTYTRDPAKKTQLVMYLGEHEDPRSAAALIQYLADIDEGVRYTAVESLLQQKNEEVSREPLIALMLNEKEESRRIKRRIIDGFVELGWDVKGHKEAVEAALPNIDTNAKLDNNNRIKKK